jgi:RNA polymerase sigma factor (sigma-70 family)
LRLEAVEDRTLASTTPAELPGFLPENPPAEVEGVSPLPVEAPPTQPPGDPVLEFPPQNFSPGDVIGPATPAADVSSFETERLSESHGLYNQGPALRPPADPVVPAPADEVFPRSKSPGPAGRPDGTSAPTTSETGTTTGDQARAPVAQAADTSTARPDHGSPSGPEQQRARAAGEPGPQTGPTPGVNQRTHDAGDRPVPKSNGTLAAAGPVRTVNGPIVRSGAGRPAADLPDGSLLHRFVEYREQEAFTALVQRHERSVLGVCRRVLGDSHAAHDAFQTTFLVLARKAGMLDRQTPLGGWLYRVAYHAALRLRSVAARQRSTEAEAARESNSTATAEGPTEVELEELRNAVREELDRLPEKYRTPLTLCYLDGRTHADAAREIGVPRGSMAKRVGEGLDRLRERLLDRGITL